jgi:chorismate dehydratase
MKIGIVKHLNARPLTYGFEKSSDHDLFFENPSVLKEELVRGNLDIALISSVECLRNQDKLSWSYSTGVCAQNKVRSILFFQNKKQTHPVQKIYVDKGSRSSVALLKILYYETYNQLVETIPEDPIKIQEKILQADSSHLLFGDNALLAHWNTDDYIVLDLAEWWNKLTSQNFCFALWAYPKGSTVNESIFYKSLEYGLQHIEEIIHSEKRFPHWLTSRYLKEELHYVLDEKDKSGFALFQKRCIDLNLL